MKSFIRNLTALLIIFFATTTFDALAKVPRSEKLEQSISNLKKDDWNTRMKAAQELINFKIRPGDEKAIQALIVALDDSNPGVRNAAYRALWQFKKWFPEAQNAIKKYDIEKIEKTLSLEKGTTDLPPTEAIPKIQMSLNDSRPSVQVDAVRALGEQGPLAVSVLGEFLFNKILVEQYEDERTRQGLQDTTIQSLANITEDHASALDHNIPLLVRALHTTNYKSISFDAFAYSVATLNTKRLLKILRKDIETGDSSTKIRAMKVIRLIGSPANSAIPELRQALQDEDVTVRFMASWALVAINPVDPDGDILLNLIKGTADADYSRRALVTPTHWTFGEKSIQAVPQVVDLYGERTNEHVSYGVLKQIGAEWKPALKKLHDQHNLSPQDILILVALKASHTSIHFDQPLENAFQVIKKETDSELTLLKNYYQEQKKYEDTVQKELERRRVKDQEWQDIYYKNIAKLKISDGDMKFLKQRLEKAGHFERAANRENWKTMTKSLKKNPVMMMGILGTTLEGSDNEYVPRMIKQLDDKDLMTRAIAAYTLGANGSEEATLALLNFLKKSPRFDTKKSMKQIMPYLNAVSGLGATDEEISEVGAVLFNLLKENVSNPLMRYTIIRSLTAQQVVTETLLRDYLTSSLTDDVPVPVLEGAIQALGAMEESELKIAPLLIKVLRKYPSIEIRLAVSEALAGRWQQSFDFIRLALEENQKKEEKAVVLIAIIDALGKRYSKEALLLVPALSKFLEKDERPEIHYAVINTFRQMGKSVSEKEIPLLVRYGFEVKEAA